MRPRDCAAIIDLRRKIHRKTGMGGLRNPDGFARPMLEIDDIAERVEVLQKKNPGMEPGRGPRRTVS
jgi:hypothetical protein